MLQGLFGIGGPLATIAALAMCVDRGATLRALDALTGASAQLQSEPPGGEQRRAQAPSPGHGGCLDVRHDLCRRRSSLAHVRPDDFLNLDALLSGEERDIRDRVRASSRRGRPFVGDWFEQATIPRELAPALGRSACWGCT